MREYEITPDKDRKRRHFEDDRLTIYVWYEPSGEMYGFQLSFMEEVPGFDTKLLEERVMTYFKGRGLTQSFIRNENRSFPTTKLLEPKNSIPSKQWILRHVNGNSGDVPREIIEFIKCELDRYIPD